MEILTDMTAIGLAGLSMILLYHMASKHIQKNTDAFHDLKGTINKLGSIIDNKLD